MVRCSAIVFLLTTDDFLFLQCLSQNLFAVRASFYQQIGVLPTLLVIFHLHCEMSPSSTLPNFQESVLAQPPHIYNILFKRGYAMQCIFL